MRNQNRNVHSTGGSRSIMRNAAAACALLFFALFLALKVNGYLDFSASYEIKELADCPELELYRMDPANGAWVLCGSSRDGNRILPDSAFAAEKILLKAAEGQTDVPWIVKELRVV